MTSILAAAALLCTTAGLVAGLAAALATRDVRLTLAVALEFWLAAGLLRLAGTPSLAMLATAAGILAVRQIVAAGFRFSDRQPDGRGRGGASSSGRRASVLLSSTPRPGPADRPGDR